MNQSRYSRQISLPEIGEGGQQKLSNSSVLCVGAGGLGSPALLYLVAAGVGRLGIADFDIVDESNLQRQILFSTEQVGETKCRAAYDRLIALNPDTKIEIHEDGLNAENVESLLSSYDLVVDGSDNFETKFLLNDACVKFDKALIQAAIQQFEGQVSVFHSSRENAPCYRCLYPETPPQQIMNCAQAGIIGAVAGIVGTTQAMQAIMMLAPHENFEPLLGKLWTIDARNMRTKLLDIPKNPECPVCTQKKEDIILTYTTPTCSQIAKMDISDLKKTPLPDHVLLIDVREEDEWDAGHIDGAIHFPLSRLMMGDMPDIDTGHDISLYCKAGVRSMNAAKILKKNGYEKLTNLTGGYDAWAHG